jgi:hypothetical protein
MLIISVNGKQASVGYKSLSKEELVHIAQGIEAVTDEWIVKWRYGAEEGELLATDSVQPRIGLAVQVEATMGKAATMEEEPVVDEPLPRQVGKGVRVRHAGGGTPSSTASTLPAPVPTSSVRPASAKVTRQSVAVSVTPVASTNPTAEVTGPAIDVVVPGVVELVDVSAAGPSVVPVEVQTEDEMQVSATDVTPIALVDL